MKQSTGQKSGARRSSKARAIGNVIWTIVTILMAIGLFVFGIVGAVIAIFSSDYSLWDKLAILSILLFSGSFILGIWYIIGGTLYKEDIERWPGFEFGLWVCIGGARLIAILGIFEGELQDPLSLVAQNI